jgi:hypothetical protein
MRRGPGSYQYRVKLERRGPAGHPPAGFFRFAAHRFVHSEKPHSEDDHSAGFERHVSLAFDRL